MSEAETGLSNAGRVKETVRRFGEEALGIPDFLEIGREGGSFLDQPWYIRVAYCLGQAAILDAKIAELVEQKS